LDALATTDQSEEGPGGVADVFGELEEMRQEDTDKKLGQESDLATTTPAEFCGEFDEERMLFVGPGTDGSEQPQMTYQAMTQEEATLKRLKEKKTSKTVLMFPMNAIKTFFWGLFMHCYLLIVAFILAVVALCLFYGWQNPALGAVP